VVVVSGSDKILTFSRHVFQRCTVIHSPPTYVTPLKKINKCFCRARPLSCATRMNERSQTSESDREKRRGVVVPFHIYIPEAFPLCGRFGWLGANGWCWFVLREAYRWLVVGGWFVLREKYCWLAADKPSEPFALPDLTNHDRASGQCLLLSRTHSRCPMMRCCSPPDASTFLPFMPN
jgi:hypothetical protein